MKKLLLFFSCFPGLVSAQYLYNFEDSTLNDWKQYPSERWVRSNNNPLSGNFSLQHGYDNPASGVDFISFYTDSPLLSDALELSFRMKHGYNPSTNNNWQISFLNSVDSSLLLEGKLSDGIYMGVNLKGSDDMLKIWQIRDELIEELLNTGFNYQDSIGSGRSPCFRLCRYPDGRWEVFCSPDGDPESLSSLGISEVSGQFTGRNFLLRYAYSSAQDRKFWFDDLQIDGEFFIDTQPPLIQSLLISGLNDLIIRFDEAVRVSAQASFLLAGTEDAGLEGDSELFQIPVDVEVSDTEVKLSFAAPFPNRKELVLRVSGVEDADGNGMGDTSIFFTANRAEWGDVVINEIMFDPTPSVHLPDCEYVELFNRSGWDLLMHGWNLEVNGKRFIIERDSLFSGDYLLICSNDCASLIMALYAVPGFSSGSVLSNSGGQIALFDRFENLIHLSPFGTLKEPDWKGEGGWSLERIDPSCLCNNQDNIGYSEDPSGGTPGRINSIAGNVSDENAPFVRRIGMIDSTGLEIHFSELIDVDLISRENFIFNWASSGASVSLRSYGSQKSYGVSGSSGSSKSSRSPYSSGADSISFAYPRFDKVKVFLPAGALNIKPGRLRIRSVYDCEGNLMEEHVFEVGLPVEAGYQTLLINEVMYNPFENAPEFIELYNHGSYFIDLEDVMIAVSDPEGKPGKRYGLSNASHIIAPGEYVVLTSDVSALISYFSLKESGQWIEPDHMPSLVNSGASVYLYSRSGEVLDYMNYSDAMHLSLVDDSQGISLERMSFNIEGSDPSNWHSAASVFRYATPGRSNSQYYSADHGKEMLTLNPPVFSPDNDGFEDVLEISLAPERCGFVLQMDVLDISGGLIIRLSNNDILGAENMYFWDGQNDSGLMVYEGMYILHAVLFHPDSREKIRIRKAFALIYR